MKEKIQGAPYFLVTDLEKCPLARFWVVQLDCGVEVFQSLEDNNLKIPNPWMRLKQFCKDHNVRIVNMARGNKDLDPTNQINLEPMADGYFYSKRVRKMMSAHPAYNGYQDFAEGVGYLKGDVLQIVWDFGDGHFEAEKRSLKDHPKSKSISLIR